jgi:two-component system sensor histidine kinase HydH
MTAPQSDPTQLREQYTEMAALAGGLAHEIRNPLSTIRMNLDLLFEDAVESEDPKTRRMLRKLETIRRECTHLEGLLNAFLQFARAGEMNRVQCDLSHLVAEFVDFYKPEAAKYGIEIRLHLDADLPPVDLDENLVRQALMNLTRNSQQAMPSGGQIEFQTLSRDGHIVLEIIDTGCGITPEAREKLFEIFFSTKQTGTGLGLPTVRKIVEAHGGTIQCDSEPGKGTRFTLSFPAKAPELMK